MCRFISPFGDSSVALGQKRKEAKSEKWRENFVLVENLKRLIRLEFITFF